MYQRELLVDCVEPFTLAMFKRILQWSDEEIQVIMAKVKGDFRNKTNRLYTNFTSFMGESRCEWEVGMNDSICRTT
jgi:hypothetical protein